MDFDRIACLNYFLFLFCSIRKPIIVARSTSHRQIFWFVRWSITKTLLLWASRLSSITEMPEAVLYKSTTRLDNEQCLIFTFHLKTIYSIVCSSCSCLGLILWFICLIAVTMLHYSERITIIPLFASCIVGTIPESFYCYNLMRKSMYMYIFWSIHHI
jgi:hypothetical protein